MNPEKIGAASGFQAGARRAFLLLSAGAPAEEGIVSLADAAMSVYEKTFTLKDEDHTMGNAVRYMLNKNPQVSLAGYSVPHPMEKSVNVRVQTTGEVTATAAMRDALLDIISVCDHVHDTFDSAVEEFKAKNPAPMDTGATGKKKK